MRRHDRSGHLFVTKFASGSLNALIKAVVLRRKLTDLLRLVLFGTEGFAGAFVCCMAVKFHWFMSEYAIRRRPESGKARLMVHSTQRTNCGWTNPMLDSESPQPRIYFALSS
ncbi:hypothetical protein DFJ73DRAFT_572109 [Zopfochytrium polystomum]|nr:hypothetical protein DFJ73DRAFT_572109 [Zopfochytrium polystomum]